MFLSQMINDRERPAVALPPTIVVTHGEIISDRCFECGGIVAMSLSSLCRKLNEIGTHATHLQIWDARDGFRRPAMFAEIASTAAWRDETSSSRRQ